MNQLFEDILSGNSSTKLSINQCYELLDYFDKRYPFDINNPDYEIRTQRREVTEKLFDFFDSNFNFNNVREREELVILFRDMMRLSDMKPAMLALPAWRRWAQKAKHILDPIALEWRTLFEYSIEDNVVTLNNSSFKFNDNHSTEIFNSIIMACKLTDIIVRVKEKESDTVLVSFWNDSKLIKSIGFRCDVNSEERVVYGATIYNTIDFIKDRFEVHSSDKEVGGITLLLERMMKILLK